MCLRHRVNPKAKLQLPAAKSFQPDILARRRYPAIQLDLPYLLPGPGVHLAVRVQQQLPNILGHGPEVQPDFVYPPAQNPNLRAGLRDVVAGGVVDGRQPHRVLQRLRVQQDSGEAHLDSDFPQSRWLFQIRFERGEEKWVIRGQRGVLRPGLL